MQQQNMDVTRAKERTEAVRAQLQELETRLQEDIRALEVTFDPSTEPIETLTIRPKAGDITLEAFGMAWLPFRKDAAGKSTPDWT
jgi:hypothetical protein